MRVLVTRPEPGASRTAEKLRKISHDPVVLPLSRVTRVRPNPIPSTLGFLGSVVTSANAIDCMPISLHRRLSELPCYVVGEHTAAKAAETGFDVRAAASNSAELSNLLRELFQRGDSLAYACGRVRLSNLEAELQAHGIRVTPVEVYDTIQVSYATDFVMSTLDDKPVDAILAYSVIASRQINEFCRQSDVSNLLSNSKIYCLSKRIADEFSGRMKNSVMIADVPNEANILDLLDRK